MNEPFEEELIEDMDVEEMYAMGEIGKTKKKDIICEACTRCDEILTRYRGFIEMMTGRLLEAREISGEEMRKAFQEYCREHEEPARP